MATSLLILCMNAKYNKSAESSSGLTGITGGYYGKKKDKNGEWQVN